MSIDIDRLQTLVEALLSELPGQRAALQSELVEAEARWIEFERAPRARDLSEARGAEDQLCRLREAKLGLEALEQQARDVVMILSSL